MFFRAVTLAAVASSTLILCPSAEAQSRYWGDYSYHASTAGEGYARGLGDVIRSQGQYNLDTSEAAKNYAQARSMEMENRYKWTKTYFEMRDLNRQYRAQEQLPQPTSEQLRRYAQAGRPDELEKDDLNPFTGQLQWPAVLREEDFGEAREVIDRMYRNRALQKGILTSDQYAAVDAASQEMEATLKDNIKKYPTSSYLEARKFLESIRYEARSGRG